MFDFLLNDYFLRIAFELIYLFESKINLFINNLKLLKFEDDSRNIRFSLKHRIKILNWSISQNKLKFDVFLWLTSFLKIFIFEKFELVMKMKRTYFIQQSNKLKSKRFHDVEIKKCDADLFKKSKVFKSKKLIIQRKWVIKNIFDWEKKQQITFDAVKKVININVMFDVDSNMQYYLAIDANKIDLKKCLFQLHEIKHNTKATSKLLSNERIIFFMSYQLLNVETRYFNNEKKCYAIIRSLTKIK